MFPSELESLERLSRAAGLSAFDIEILPGDVGRRRYARLTISDNRTVLGVVYPAEEADSRRRWLSARAAIRSGVRVPEVLADDGERAQLVEDFGRQDLAGRLSAAPEERAAWLERASDAAAAIAGLPDPGVNPPFDSSLFRRELELAREAVFDGLLGSPLPDAARRTHDLWADALVAEVLEHPRALCHRDFHANNLFPAAESVGVIDFQDARSGPDAYDLASLLWERTTLDWMTPETASSVISRFARRRALETGAFAARLSRVLLQRAWKVCGTFARAVAQGKGAVYRRYLPGELALVRRLLGDSDADRRFAAVLESRAGALC